MTFDWHEFLQVAKFLQEQAGTSISHEAASRSAVSRAYYATFGTARNFAITHLCYPQSLPQGTESHLNLRQYLESHGAQEIAKRLWRLRNWRNKCDYDEVIKNEGVSVRDIGLMTSSAISSAEDLYEMISQKSSSIWH